MKTSRFVEELPGDPAVYELWQLDTPAERPALAAANDPAAARPQLAPAGALHVPSLFGDERMRLGPAKPDPADGGDDDPA